MQRRGRPAPCRPWPGEYGSQTRQSPPGASMDSINRNQPEDNHRDVQGREAVQRLQAVVKKTQTCFFCTAQGHGPSEGTRPMNVRQVDDTGRLWFLSADDSHKNLELARDPTVQLFFQ